MKITKDQVNALAMRISNSFIASKKATKKEAEYTPEVEALALKDFETLKQLSPTYRDEHIQERFANLNYLKKMHKNAVDEPEEEEVRWDYEVIKNEIILAAPSCRDFDEIEKKVNDKKPS